MSRTAVLLSLGALMLTLLVAWLTWNYVFTSVDRVFWLMLFGVGSLGGQ
ncbi:hypothetical protein GCM10022197_05110 [Microlunatus spumicola]|uniref:Uncharacterized protein n=1 Tax=Microlunatus spumicola TaxID=81499 RepID=A0ABP6WMH5_9ACTN